MIRHLPSLSCVFLAIAISSGTAANANENQCGERVGVNDVLVVDMEEFVDQEDLFPEKLREQVGDFIIVSPKPLSVRWTGNRVRALNNAKKYAAHQGCDLLVQLGFRTVETRWQGKVTKERSITMHMGKRVNP